MNSKDNLSLIVEYAGSSILANQSPNSDTPIFKDILKGALKKGKVTCIGKIRNPEMVIPLQISSAMTP